MKFSQLVIGDRFIYQDTEYTKSGPLQAVAKSTGIEKMIMRAANVQLPQTHSAENDQRSEETEGVLEALLATYHNACMENLTGTDNNQKRIQMEALFNKIQQEFKNVFKKNSEL
ncbi:MAG: hypothetical protein OQL27_11585 [Sedimenticola sp.]|nr:hypothetical protein [Sedimenticola sp.]